MNKFEKWFLSRILSREVRGGPGNIDRHTALYQMIRDAHRKEYPEDNFYNSDDFLSECFHKTQFQNLFGILRK